MFRPCSESFAAAAARSRPPSSWSSPRDPRRPPSRACGESATRIPEKTFFCSFVAVCAHFAWVAILLYRLGNVKLVVDAVDGRCRTCVVGVGRTKSLGRGIFGYSGVGRKLVEGVHSKFRLFFDNQTVFRPSLAIPVSFPSSCTNISFVFYSRSCFCFSFLLPRHPSHISVLLLALVDRSWWFHL